MTPVPPNFRRASRRFVLAAAAFAVLTSTGGSAAAAQAVKLTSAQERALGVRSATLKPAARAPIASLPATFVRPPGGRSAVTAPFDGSLVQVLVVEGQRVAANQVLATVFSRAALDEAATLRQAEAESVIATATAARTRKLVEEGIVAGARQAEAEARARAAQAVVQAKSRSLRAGGVDASGRYALRAPFSGRVASVALGAGEGVAAMATVFVVDREDRIQVEAILPAALAGQVAERSRAVVEGVEAQVVAVGAAIDPKTRSLSVRAEVPPRAGFLPGRSTRLELYADGLSGFSIPRAALTNIDGQTMAFVRTATGFAPRPVQVLGYSGSDAVIAGAGLGADVQVAVAGISELKARSQP